MKSILSFGLTALAATTSSVSAETTVAILEFGPGGSVHRTTSAFTESKSAAVSSLWNVLHRPSSKRSSSQHTGMTVVPDLFTRADAGIVIGLQGESLKSMPTAMSLLDAGAPVDNVVGHVHVRGQAGAELMKLASSKDVEMVSKEDIGRRLQSAAETAASGALGGIDALSLAVDNDDAAAVADEQLRRMLKTLKKQAAANGKTVVLHLVADSTRRRLDEDSQDGDQDGENENNNNAYWNEKTMYEIQTFNLFLWTAVGLIVILFMVMSKFIDMPLFPDTLLFGEAKMGTD
mmetsp:Transcript_28576/g.51652  ORF Transcript_28576/g.51652 Transcript_28576/m.51652 type:complete len:290 (-) Transcript_28576:103-972(-)|eukprot:CAMPEP_0201869206 /NCGR_PEP_ID=MMETSP0902-20130614/2806_1 /ASSEMBLY_ACC=CAM_ASM_000551 /TAXON_ID=420261 /ORGANISM="Thalassiosira antarctica, Strain CCMP982" /LENGTH=289 /DNA_ID=CAMNT_0048394671 /DNA_START=44 /DNA_END=913 /DNA_ORIENTATION=+